MRWNYVTLNDHTCKIKTFMNYYYVDVDRNIKKM